jgi:hypothetical protein
MELKCPSIESSMLDDEITTLYLFSVSLYLSLFSVCLLYLSSLSLFYVSLLCLSSLSPYIFLSLSVTVYVSLSIFLLNSNNFRNPEVSVVWRIEETIHHFINPETKPKRNLLTDCDWKNGHSHMQTWNKFGETLNWLNFQFKGIFGKPSLCRLRNWQCHTPEPKI